MNKDEFFELQEEIKKKIESDPKFKDEIKKMVEATNDLSPSGDWRDILEKISDDPDNAYTWNKDNPDEEAYITIPIILSVLFCTRPVY